MSDEDVANYMMVLLGRVVPSRGTISVGRSGYWRAWKNLLKAVRRYTTWKKIFNPRAKATVVAKIPLLDS